ncbi:N-acetylmuramoyl-L-alanine amidase [Anaerobacillus sp. MEB173]|uniref:N-acetylmuramoyl-L-alanine amidase n=1 Tax=Anaerobacillus sp. MEB173 TaxID=3383345 RepID=UPI003F8E6ABB
MSQNRLFIASIFMVFFVLFLVQPVSASAAQEGTITSNNVNVRAEASTSSEILGKLNSGAKVTITGESGSWVKISYNNRTAYVHADFVRKSTPQQSSPSNQSSTGTTIIVNGNKLSLAIEPPMESNHILVPFRAIGEALGIDVKWNQSLKQVNANDRGKKVLFTINQEKTIVNNQTIDVKPAPKIIRNHTVIPLRFFAETFGANVNWDQKSKTVTIQRTAVESEQGPNTPPTQISQEDNFVGIVESTTLNVRSGAGTSHSLVTTLNKGDQVVIEAIQGNWVKVKTSNHTGFVHSYYLDVYKDGERSPLLSGPQLNRDVLTWSKIGKVNSSHTATGNTIEIKTSAKEVEEWTGTHPAIERVTYTKTSTGTTINLYIKQGFSFNATHTTESLTIALLAQGQGSKTIVIDPGHGGKDPGAVAFGLQEKDIVLDVGLRVQKLLKDTDLNVIMTRSTDVFLTLDERVKVGEAAKADAFVSIHTNGAENKAANGTETYWDSKNSSEQSKQLAEKIQKKLLAKLGTNDRGVKQAGFHVIRNSKMPSVLIELGFTTNEAEANRMKTDDFRQKSAEAIVEGIKEFYGK